MVMPQGWNCNTSKNVQTIPSYVSSFALLHCDTQFEPMCLSCKIHNDISFFDAYVSTAKTFVWIKLDDRDREIIALFVLSVKILTTIEFVRVEQGHDSAGTRIDCSQALNIFVSIHVRAWVCTSWLYPPLHILHLQEF